jgi:hypothetical protein
MERINIFPIYFTLLIIETLDKHSIPFNAYKSFAFYWLLGARSSGSWLRHYARRRKIAGSSPDEVDYFQFT